MENKSSAAGSGVGLGGLMFIVFLVLKLCNVINWSWWWVTAPLWMPVALGLAIFIIWLVVYLIVDTVKDHRRNKRR